MEGCRLGPRQADYKAIEIEGPPALPPPPLHYAKALVLLKFFSASYVTASILWLLYFQVLLLLPSTAAVDQGNGSHLQQATRPECTVIYGGEVVLVGAVVVLIALPVILLSIGLGPFGPLAGGAFAAWQAAHGAIAAGSIMALLQSMAMGGSVVAASIIAAIGAALGGLTAAEVNDLIHKCNG